jgi:GntR family transcriptional repressor for pyruvate dehydrogenase complex
VLDQILARLRDGGLRPGDRLPGELELTRLLGVGRSSVREALRALITLGLVETRPGRGAVVRLPAPDPLAHLAAHGASVEHLQKWALLDLLEVRESLEGQAAALAARRATAADLAAIEHHLAETAARIRDGRTYFRANARLHLAIARASHNAVLARSIGHLIGQARAYRERLMREAPGMPARDVAEHEAIVDAIRTGKAVEAQECAAAHIHSFTEAVRRFVGDGPRPPAADAPRARGAP